MRPRTIIDATQSRSDAICLTTGRYAFVTAVSDSGDKKYALRRGNRVRCNPYCASGSDDGFQRLSASGALIA